MDKVKEKNRNRLRKKIFTFYKYSNTKQQVIIKLSSFEIEMWQ